MQQQHSKTRSDYFDTNDQLEGKGSASSRTKVYPIVTQEVRRTVEENLRSLMSTPTVATQSETASTSTSSWNPSTMVLGWTTSPLPMIASDVTTIVPMTLVNTVSNGTPSSTISHVDDSDSRKRRGQLISEPEFKRSRPMNNRVQDRFKYVSDEMYRYAQSNLQSGDRLQQKLRLRSALLAIFRRDFPAASLHLVGSSCNGFANDTSDADFCLMLTHERQIDQKNEALFYLQSLRKNLRHVPSMRNIQLIKAKVPILKFRDTISSCDCDVNVNNATGIRNTHLLRTYSRIDDRVRPMVLAVKRWAKVRRINDASQGTLSSYSLVLMVLHYMQSGCHPPCIVSLQDKYPDYFDLSLNVDMLPMFDPTDKIPCNQSENRESLGELLAGFFKYYAKTFRWDFLVASVRLGRAIPRSISNEWTGKYMCIEEPFDRTNTARAVYQYHSFEIIRKEFNRANERMKGINADYESIL